VLEAVKQSSRRTRALLDNAQVTNVVGEAVSLAAPGALAKMIAEDSNTSVLRSALTKVVGGSWKISVEVGGGPGGVSASSSAQVGRAPAAAAAEDDPRDDSEPADEPTAAPPVDPEADAIKLLQDQLGARAIE